MRSEDMTYQSQGGGISCTSVTAEQAMCSPSPSRRHIMSPSPSMGPASHSNSVGGPANRPWLAITPRLPWPSGGGWPGLAGRICQAGVITSRFATAVVDEATKCARKGPTTTALCQALCHVPQHSHHGRCSVVHITLHVCTPTGPRVVVLRFVLQVRYSRYLGKPLVRHALSYA